MERKYYTTHKGVAGYLVMKGFSVLRCTQENGKDSRPRVKVEFDVDPQTGKEVGDEFFNGGAMGNLKEFYDACGQVGQLMYQARR
jgi:hypothetical protein